MLNNKYSLINHIKFFLLLYVIRFKAESKWKKILKKISFSPINEDYYKDQLLKPGFEFYKLIGNTNLENNYLKVPIPETFISIES